MSIAKTVEISATSTKSFEDAVHQGIARAAKSIENIRSAWIKDQKLTIKNNKVSEYRVILKVTFELNK